MSKFPWALYWVLEVLGDPAQAQEALELNWGLGAAERCWSLTEELGLAMGPSQNTGGKMVVTGDV